MKTKTVVLVKIWNGDSDVPQSPLSLLLLGTSLKEAGYNVKIIHSTKNNALSRVDEVLKHSPLLVGFSVITGDPLDIVLDFCKKIKNKNKKIPIIMGGVHPTSEPEQCLQEKCIDFVGLYEGERVIVELAQALENKRNFKNIKSLGYRENNRIIINPPRELEKNLDEFDIDWDLINIEDYIFPNYDETDRVLNGYVTSRGCPHNCGFCYNHFFNKRRWRCQSASKVIKDVNLLADNYNIKGIMFFDDNFMVNKERALTIFKNIKVKPLHIELRIDYISRDYLDELKNIGVKSFFIGVESGSDRLLKLVSKGYDSKKIIENLKILKEYDLSLKLSFILGIPTETLPEYRKTLNLIVWCIENLPKVGFTIGFYLPYPATPLYDLCEQMGFKKPKSFKQWVAFDRHGKKDFNFTNVNHVSAKEIRKLRMIAVIMGNCIKSQSKSRNLVYKIFKFRFMNSGKKWMKPINYVENVFLSFRDTYKNFKQ